jgi:flagellar hook protein FlgE
MNIQNNASSMLAHQAYMNANAHNVANVNTNGFKPTDTTLHEAGNGGVQASFSQKSGASQEQSQTNLTEELTEQVVVQRGFEANAPAIKTQDEMMGTLLDIKG